MRKILTLFLLAGLTAWTIDNGAAQTAERPPNFVIIFCDDLGYGDLGSFGHPTIRTPNLDRMAAEGQRWTNFYACDSVCTPSRAGLLTGRLPVRSGMTSDSNTRRVLFPDSAGGLPREEITIAELLKPRGYATAHVGKWHLGHLPQFLPTRQGFDSYFGIPYSNDMDWTGGALPAEDRRRRTMDPKIEYWNAPLLRNETVIERPAEQATLTRRYTDEAIKFIKANARRPFFLYLAHTMPHMPLFRSKEFEGRSPRGVYGDVIEELDWSVGRVLETLRQLQLDRRTLVVFTSDNGPWAVYNEQGGSAGLLRGAKGGTFEGGMRVPAIFWGPGLVKRGVVAEIGSTLDLLPTMCGLAGVKAPTDRAFDGYDLTAALRGAGHSPRQTMFYYRGAKLYAIRHGAFKAHFFTRPEYGNDPEVAHDPPLLYNLDHDPSEKFDVARHRPEVIAELRRIAEAHIQTVKPVKSQLDERLPAETTGSDKRPNIVIILVDDMGWSDIASYGGEIPTPNLDALAKNGVRFTQFYNTARCSPTRASLLTGHYPHQAGMGYLDNLIRQDSLGYQGKISDRSVTIAEVLKASGYFTAMTGKWHLGQQNGTPPWKRGFDRSLNIRAGGIFFPNQSGNPNDPLSSRAKEPLYLNGAGLPQTAPEFGQDWYATYLWTDFGLKFIDEALKEKKPFFLYLAHNAPHFPLMAPKELIAKYKGKYMAGWDKLREARYRRQLKMGLVDPKWPLSPRAADTPAWDSLSPAERERYDHMMAVYAAMIEAIDRSVGALVKGLNERQALDNTLILFLSDNGGNGEAGPKGRSEGKELGGKDSTVYIGMNWAALNNTPFRRFKHFTHEGGVSTPLIAHWPAGIPKTRNGKLEHQPGHLIDIMATVVEITGAKYPAESGGQAIYPMEGLSLRPAFNGRPLKRAEPIFFEHEGNRAIRFGKWKLVSKYMDGWELYDLEADRTELNDLAERRPEIVKDLSARWEAWAKRTHTDQWIGPRRNDWGEVPKP